MPDASDLDLDTAISADLDGDLDAMCADLGLDPTAVRARLAAPEAAARRARLTAARDALAAPVHPLDDLARRRLVQGALADAEPDTTIPARSATSGGSDRSRRRWSLLAGAAAAVLVVVGVVALTRQVDDGSASKSSGSSTANAPKGDLGDVGSLDQSQVDRLVDGGGTTGAGSDSAATGSAPAAEGFTENATSVPAARVAECAAGFASEGTVRFRASGDFQGRPAVIVGVDTETRTIVFVVAADDCTQVLYSASR